jgi:3-oxoacyl-[acyl-carrier protein] reductase
MNLGVRDHIALVTAASRGLGAAVARCFAQEGAQVIICARDEARLSAAVTGIEADTGAPVVGIQADVTVGTDVDALVEEVIESFGQIDHLVVKAGGPPAGGFASFQPEDWEKAAHLTLMSAVRLCYAVVPHMKKQQAGSIVFITSFVVKQPAANLILSNSVRMALVGLMKSLSQELGPAGIRVNAVAPGWTLTERVRDLLATRAMANGSTPEAEAARIVDDLPLGRMAQPEELARAAVFLSSLAASYITGVLLPVDGGAIKASL